MYLFLISGYSTRSFVVPNRKSVEFLNPNPDFTYLITHKKTPYIFCDDIKQSYEIQWNLNRVLNGRNANRVSVTLCIFVITVQNMITEHNKINTNNKSNCLPIFVKELLMWSRESH